MIKIAYNKENPALVFEVDGIERDTINAANTAGVIEKYVGTIKDTKNNTEKQNVKISVLDYQVKWDEVPVNVVETGTEIHNQEKAVTPTTSQQVVEPDTGYTGLNKVTVAAAPLETANVTPTTSEQTITATGTGKIGLSSVTVAGVTSAIDANITAENIKKDTTILGVTGSLESGPEEPTDVDITKLYRRIMFKPVDDLGEYELNDPEIIQSWTDIYDNYLDVGYLTSSIVPVFEIPYANSETPYEIALNIYVGGSTGVIYIDFVAVQTLTSAPLVTLYSLTVSKVVDEQEVPHLYVSLKDVDTTITANMEVNELSICGAIGGVTGFSYRDIDNPYIAVADISDYNPSAIKLQKLAIEAACYVYPSDEYTPSTPVIPPSPAY